MLKTCNLLLDEQVRLHLRLMAAVYDLNMSQMTTKLIEDAYESDKTLLDKKQASKVRRIIRKWR
jgi:hypothetical protein